ncbi:MAG TPA: glutathione-disulfide reductase [Caulobacterales bacterium]|nr:glutathione-disulfide reductase [Caulobacterales bacterium]
MAYDFDLFTIGAGSGGVRAARVAAQAGARVAVAEEFRIGGTCVIRGCVPKKLLVYASEYPQTFRDARGFGWTTGEARFDWPTLRGNVAAEVERLSQAYARNMASAGVKEIIRERAEFVDPHHVKLVESGRTIGAERILIATGGRPHLPRHVPGIEHAITSNEVFSLDRLPRRALVWGGGYVACEFAAVFNGLGVETRLLYRGETILRGFDDEVRALAQAEMRRQGVDVVTGLTIAAIEKRGQALICRLSDGSALETDLVLAAIGRVPNTDALGLDRAGVETDEDGAVIVDPFSQTSAPSIYAVGDVTNRTNLTPVAIREGQAFADTVFNNRPTMFQHADIPTAVFANPQIGAVGATEAHARERYGKIDVYKSSYRPMKNILAGNEQRSFMKIIVRAGDDAIVGVHMIGPVAAELAQLAAVAVRAGMTKTQWDLTCALHPTEAEELVTMKTKEKEPQAVA